MYGIFIILLLAYSTYFGIISYIAFFSIQQLRKSYRLVLFTTFGIIVWSILMFFVNGYSGDQMPTIGFVSVYALFNIYMYSMAYLYSPSADLI